MQTNPMMASTTHALAFLVVAVLALSACTAMEDAGNDVTRKFEDGITGQGRLVSPDPSGDQFGSYYQ